MNNIRILAASLVLLAASFVSGVVRADSFNLSPDTVTFTPSSGQTTVTAYIRAAYNGDTTGPGTTVHAWISSGTSYFSVDTTPHHFKSYYYWVVTYRIQNSVVTGTVSFSDDTVTKNVHLIGLTAPDGVLSGVGPYWTAITDEDSTSCTTMRMINTGSDRDTIVSAGWTHNPSGIFVWDTASLPTTVGAHDTLLWNFCFHAPNDTLYRTDTFNVYYHDSSSQTRYFSRIVSAHATGPQPDGVLSAIGPYWTGTQEDSTNCTTMRLINTGSDRDTIVSAGWTHNPSGIFVWDTASLPTTVGAHDTVLWNFCFHAPNDTLYRTDTFVVYYHDSASQTRSVARIVSTHATGPQPDGEISGYGPYFSTTQEDSTSCTTLRLINTGSDRDTIISAGWTQNPNGIFSWDTASMPTILGAHDTLFWNFCFHAPNDTIYHVDTFVVNYRDSAFQTRSLRRTVYARAATPAPDGYIRMVGPYWTAPIKEGNSSCQNVAVINTGADVDTVVSASWTHNPNGIFTWDTTNVPSIIGAHDTALWNFCFHAPYDTNYHIDTFVVYYRDAYSQTRSFSRIIEARAVDSSLQECYYIYPQSSKVTEVGDTSYIHIYISNRLDSTVTLTGLHISGSGDAAYRVDSSTFPHTIAGGHYDSLWIAFIPYANGTSNSFPATITGLFTSNDTTHCKTATASLDGLSALYASDTQSVNFNDTGIVTVNLSGDSGRYSHRIEFVNDSSTSLLVHSIVLSNNNHFYIAQTLPPTPDTLAPGKKISIIVHFYGDSSGTIYNDTIIADIDHAFTSFTVYLKGKSMLAPFSAVAVNVSSTADLEIYPNPSQGVASLELAGVSNANYEVLDVLGTVIAQHSGAGAWQWNAEHLPSGSYYVRASGIDANGRAIVTTRQIVLTR